MAKLKFRDLPKSLQQQYGYNVEKAAAYEIEQARVSGHLRIQMLADEQAARARRRSNELVEAQAELVLLEAKLKAIRSEAIVQHTGTIIPASTALFSLGSGHWVKKTIDGGKLVHLRMVHCGKSLRWM